MSLDKLSVNDIAELAHEVNRAYCLSQLDFSQLPWDDAPDWQKESAIKGVKFHLEHPEATPEMSHNEWLKEKEAAGWKYGPVKNIETKEHPCFCSYQQLPPEQRAKDYLFRGVVRACAPKEEVSTVEEPADKKSAGEKKAKKGK